MERGGETGSSSRGDIGLHGRCRSTPDPTQTVGSICFDQHLLLPITLMARRHGHMTRCGVGLLPAAAPATLRHFVYQPLGCCTNAQYMTIYTLKWSDLAPITQCAIMCFFLIGARSKNFTHGKEGGGPAATTGVSVRASSALALTFV